MELGSGEFHAGNDAADRAPFSPASSLRSRAPAREIGRLQRERGEGGEASGLDGRARASFSFCIFTIWAARSRSRPYQKGFMDKHFHVDGLPVQSLQPLSISMKASRRRAGHGPPLRSAEQRAGLAEVQWRASRWS